MAKERVIVFDGEHNFIAPKNKRYDKKKGKSEFVNQVGDPVTTPPKDDVVIRTNLVPVQRSRGTQFTAISQPTQPQVLPMPQVGEVDFCNKIQAWMMQNTSSPNFSPEQQAIAQSLFQNNCLQQVAPPPPPPPQSGIGSPLPVEVDLPPTTPPQISNVSFPNFELLGCNDLDIEIASIQNTLATNKFDALTKNIYTTALAKAQAVKTQKCNPATAPTPQPPTTSPILGEQKVEIPLVLPLGSPALGIRPFAGGGGGGGGSQEQTLAPKKSNYLIWILLGVGALYLLTRKKKNK
jgi:hypothetical protein